jgi:alkylation response protein AidB-like acyl-CoA dehydrogenase
VRGPAGLAINAAPGGFLVAFAVDENNAPLAFLARADQDGVRVGAPEPTLGLRAMPLAELSFDAFALAPADVIAAGDQARSFYRALLRRVSLAVSASAVGLLQAAHRQAVKYAAERYQGGMMIIDHPHLRTILGAMTAAQVGAEGALFRATDAADLATALGAKVAVTEAAVRVATDAVQILGGYGYMRDYGLEKRMRDAATLALLPISNPRAELLLAALDQERLG